VQLIPVGTRSLENWIVAGPDTLSLTNAAFRVQPENGLTLQEGGGPETLTFTYETAGGFAVSIAYTFSPDSYVVDVETSVLGVDRPLIFTHLGSGIAPNEADSVQEVRAMAWVGNHLDDGIEATALNKVDEAELIEGPFRWAAFKSRYFVTALLPGAGVEGEEVYLGGLRLTPSLEEYQASMAVALPTAVDGVTRYRLFFGPQDHARLQSLGTDLEDVNPYGWKFFRPIIRPFVGIILAILNFLHNTLSIGYGWVLILFGVIMRIVLWPLNQKAMRSQLKNMAVQPLMKEIQTKYKDNPERLQKEMMKLYKEHGFNPLGGCLPMLIPFPVLIALFFTFQNTIELRGVEFLWLADLSAKDPLYILPLFLAVSMFALQFISLRSMPEANPQMKVMMWFMPLFMGFIFLQFPSGLNLYYATSNIATIPQQILIARERKKVKPLTSSGGGGGGDGDAPKREPAEEAAAAEAAQRSSKGGKSRKSRRNRKK
jgi:YidC/Oxa1 family membrane protein insertase